MLALWTLACVVPHLIERATGKSRWPRRFLAGTARICGVDVRVTGRLASRRALLAANHLTWLDIPVLAAATGCAFISKAELAGHPVLRWLADQNRTLYIDRSDRRALHEQAEAIRDALRRDQPVALFPESTVGGGDRLLPFRPALLSAAIPPPPGSLIQPIALEYGSATRDLAWARGEHGVANAMRILGRKGRMTATVHLLDPLDPALDRKAAARAAHDAIAAALAPSGIAPADL
jgi:1-acyl-sn-glycerol-3-phosphate acyltransferase